MDLVMDQAGIGQKRTVPWARAVARVMSRQLAVELFGMPGYSQTLKGPHAEGFAAAPRDFRPVHDGFGRAVLSGRYALGGARLTVGEGGDPWNRPCPSRAFATELHRFSWMPHLVSLGEEGAREAMRLTLGWIQVFGNWSDFAWGRSVLARRLINLSGGARALTFGVGPDGAGQFADSLLAQARHLKRLPFNRLYAAEETIALLLVGCVLEGRVADGLREQGLSRLARALDAVLLEDGCHRSRNPEAMLELLFDLHMLEDALVQRMIPTPDAMSTAMSRLVRAIRTLRHPDGSLAAFQGGEGLPTERVSSALPLDETLEPPVPVLNQGRFHRLVAGRIVVLVDAGEAHTGDFGAEACDHPMALELSAGGERLIVGPGWSHRAAERQEFRIAGAASTLTLGELPLLAPMSGKMADLLGHPLEGRPYGIRSHRAEAADRGILLEMEHDGWGPRFGLRHSRRLYIDPSREEVRGEDQLIPVGGAKPGLIAAPFTIRFLLHPHVKVTISRDQKSALLSGLSGQAWWLRSDANDMQIDPGAVFIRGRAQHTQQVVLKGIARTDTPTRVRWKVFQA